MDRCGQTQLAIEYGKKVEHLADLKVLIMGAGRMGEILAAAMAQNHRVSIYDRDQEKGRQAAERAGCGLALPGEALARADAVVLALPPAVTAKALADITGHITPEMVVVNIATSVFKDDLRPVLEGRGHLVGAKIVGHYREMGSRPVIVVDADSDRGREAAVDLFSCLGQVEPGDERQVGLINTVATREAFRAAVAIERILREQGIGQALIKSALGVVAAGSVKSYAEEDIGPFAQKLLEEIKSRES